MSAPNLTRAQILALTEAGEPLPTSFRLLGENGAPARFVTLTPGAAVTRPGNAALADPQARSALVVLRTSASSTASAATPSPSPETWLASPPTAASMRLAKNDFRREGAHFINKARECIDALRAAGFA
jgi:hypothetical protein